MLLKSIGITPPQQAGRDQGSKAHLMQARSLGSAVALLLSVHVPGVFLSTAALSRMRAYLLRNTVSNIGKKWKIPLAAVNEAILPAYLPYAGFNDRRLLVRMDLLQCVMCKKLSLKLIEGVCQAPFLEVVP